MSNSTYRVISLLKSNKLLLITAVLLLIFTTSLAQIIHPKDSLLLPKVTLDSAGRRLKEVVISSRRSLVKQEIDRISYAVSADPEKNIISVLDILAKVPLVSVDADNHIKIKGNSNFRVFINGKPSAMIANNPAEALRGMKASNVRKIEVITNPPAKYDAEGIGGIINIILIKQAEDGYKAGIGSNYKKYVGLGENGYFNIKEGKIGLSFNGYTYQDLKRKNNQQSELTTVRPVFSGLLQNGSKTYHSRFGSGSVELSYEIDSLNLLTASLSVYESRDHSQISQLSQLFNGENKLTQSYTFNNAGYLKDNTLDAGLNYQVNSKQHKNQVFTFFYQYHNAPQLQHDEITFGQPFNVSLPDYSQNNRNAIHEHTLQADFSRSSKKIIYETGLKAILRHGFSNFQYDYSTGAATMQGNILQNQFSYDQDVYSAYHSLDLKSRSLEVKAGLRFEYTDIDADFDTQSVHLQKGFLNLIPVVSIQHLFEYGSINLGFTQRIERPAIYQLNPFVDRSNPQFISAGNPGLKPVVYNNFELSYQSLTKFSYHALAGYQLNNNSIQQITKTQDTASYNTYLNIGRSRSFVLDAGFSYAFLPGFRVIFNSNISHLNISGADQDIVYKNSGWMTTTYTNLNYKIGDTWRLASTIGWSSRSILLQGQVNGSVFNVTRISKELFHKNASVSFSLNNPYRRYRYVKNQIVSPAFNQSTIQQLNFRSYTVSLNYSFGRLDESKIKKSAKKIGNDDSGSENKANH